MEYDKANREIILNRNLSDLDRFVLDFIKITRKHVDYVVISGYISILLGRARSTEDVDVFIKKIPFGQFATLYKDLKDSGFWCLNAEKPEEVFSYLKDGLAVRFSRSGKAVPNIEVKFPKRQLDEDTFLDLVKVRLHDGEIIISSLERHIAFKRYYLKSDKDLEDAAHVEELFREKIDFRKVNKIKELIDRLDG